MTAVPSSTTTSVSCASPDQPDHLPVDPARDHALAGCGNELGDRVRRAEGLAVSRGRFRSLRASGSATPRARAGSRAGRRTPDEGRLRRGVRAASPARLDDRGRRSRRRARTDPPRRAPRAARSGRRRCERRAGTRPGPTRGSSHLRSTRFASSIDAVAVARVVDGKQDRRRAVLAQIALEARGHCAGPPSLGNVYTSTRSASTRSQKRRSSAGSSYGATASATSSRARRSSRRLEPG